MKLTYRPEIDGLRTISVIAVIFYHAQITILGQQPFKGGFVGVDIFPCNQDQQMSLSLTAGNRQTYR